MTAATLFTALAASGSDIAVIGGADGPTAVFVAGRTSWIALAVAGALIAAVVCCIAIAARKKK